MAFIDDVKRFSERANELKDNINTEEATKMSMIVPFFQLLGYDVFNPNEFCPEFTADYGTKKGEKVDYAIIINGEPTILIECKWCGEPLDKHGSQLFRYFTSTPAKFGILTNGIVYRFYTDLEQSNVMDQTPFLEFNTADVKENTVAELQKFCKEAFDKDSIFSTASELKYINQIRDVLKDEFDDPSEPFMRFILNNIYDGQKNQNVLLKFKPIIKKSITAYINDIVNAKISSALSKDSISEPIKPVSVVPQPKDEVEETSTPVSDRKIITTDDELQSFYIIRGILCEVTNPENIVYRDTQSYFGILFQDNNRKPICRVNLDKKQKRIMIPDEDRNFMTYYIDSLNDIYQYKSQLIEVAKRYTEN